jgi:hypothetical protein
MGAPYARAWSCGSNSPATTSKSLLLISDEAKLVTMRNEHFIAIMSSVCFYVFSKQGKKKTKTTDIAR